MMFIPKRVSMLILKLLIIFSILILVMYVIQRSLLFIPAKLTLAEVRKGAAVCGLELWPSSDMSYLGLVTTAGKSQFTNGTIIVFQGNAGCALDRSFYADALTPLGYRVILFEYPAYGARGGALGEKPLVDSAREAVKTARAMFGGPIYFWGESLGAGVACSTLKGIESDIAGVVLLTPWDNLPDLAQSIYWFLPARWLIRDKFNNARNIRDYKGPVAVVMSGHDSTIPNRFTLKLYDSIATRKMFHKFENSGHNDWPSAPGELWWKDVTMFVSGRK
jgi:uncharacterized protein